MRNLGENARWPRKTDKAIGYKDKSKWCAYHEDFGHITDECIVLRRELGYLLSKGHFKELFGRKKQGIQDPENIHEKTAQPSLDARVINFISGGSIFAALRIQLQKEMLKKANWKMVKDIVTSTTTNQKC